MYIKEKFKPIPGYPNHEIDEQGNLYNIKTGRFLKWSILEFDDSRVGGYYRANLLYDGSRRTLTRHRALAMAFKMPKGDHTKLLVNHLNGIPGDDFLDNLEWCTHSENTQHAYDNNLHPKKVTPVLVWDRRDNTITAYITLSSCARSIDMEPEKLRWKMRGKGYYLSDRYIVKYDNDTPWPDIVTTGTWICRDVESNKFIITDSIDHLSKWTGVKPDLIKHSANDCNMVEGTKYTFSLT